MGVGVALGVSFDNMALGIGLGVAIGTIFMVGFAAAGSRLAQGGRETRGGREEGPDAASGDLDDPDGT